MRSKFRVKVSSLLYATAAVAIIACLAGGGAWAQTAVPSGSALVAIHPATRLPPGSALIGSLPASFPMHIVMTLRLRNVTQLDAFLAQTGHPLLTPSEFEMAYSPSPAQAQAVAAFLTQAGFKNIVVSPNRLLVSGDASSGIVAATFHTSFAQVLTAHGRHAFATTADVLIPASLQSSILAVLGVQNVYEAHTFDIVSDQGVAPQPDTSGGGSEIGHDPTDFPVIYGASNLSAAGNVTAGIVTSGNTTDMTNVENNLSYFTSQNNLPAVNVQVVGSGNQNASAEVEWDLDSEDIVAMGGVQNLILYDAVSLGDSDLTADYNTIVSDDLVKVVNVSLGECEANAKSDGAAASDDQIFEQADAQGQTFSVSTGDSGADECGNGTTTPAYPASSPYVVAVGGTALFTSGNTTWANETVWNDSYGATGGSPSTFESQPAWQHGVYPNSQSVYRGVADIAFDADPVSGAQIIVNVNPPESDEVGGTSLASPLFVGTWARILESKGTAIGFAAPTLYGAASANYANDFHDVTSGNNNGENAGAGWDYPTGFGSLVVNNIVNNINAAPSASSLSASSLDCDSEYDLQWTSVPNATTYNLWFLYTPNGGGWNSGGSTTGTSEIARVPSGETEYFVVQACSGSTCGAASNETRGLPAYSGCF